MEEYDSIKYVYINYYYISKNRNSQCYIFDLYWLFSIVLNKSLYKNIYL